MAYRYLRFTITANSAGTSLGILWELDYSADGGSTWLPSSAMTTNSAPSPLVASADSEFSGLFQAWQAFDNNTSTRWTSTNTSMPHHITIDLGAGNEITPNKVRWYNYNDGTNYSVVSGSVKGSNTGSFAGEETTLLSFSGLSGTADKVAVTLDINVAYSLVAAAGSYALTGVAATLNAGKTIIIEAGSYALTGVAAAFAAVISMPAAAGAYVLTGVDAVLAQGKVLTAAAGSYVLTGIAAFQKISMNAVAGAYALTGVSAAVQYTMNTLAGAYTLAGQIATLIRGSVVYADAGSYVLTGLANIMARASIPQIYKRVRNSYARLKGYARDVILKE